MGVEQQPAVLPNLPGQYRRIGLIAEHHARGDPKGHDPIPHLEARDE